MKIKRYKRAYRNLNFYVNNFGFHTPFQILIDGTFCFSALQSRIQIREDVPKYLGNCIKFLTTQCVILETEKLGHKVIPAMKIIKTFGIHNCGHQKKALSGSDCFLSMVQNNNSCRYIVATQDKELQKKLEQIPAVPVLYINRTSIILKPPSESTLHLAKNKKEEKLNVTDYQKQILNTLKIESFGKLKDNKDNENVIMAKKTKGPNPLSCKKRKKPFPEIHYQSSNDVTSDIKQNKKRKKKRLRVPMHIKEEILHNVSVK